MKIKHTGTEITLEYWEYQALSNALELARCTRLLQQRGAVDFNDSRSFGMTAQQLKEIDQLLQQFSMG